LTATFKLWIRHDDGNQRLAGPPALLVAGGEGKGLFGSIQWVSWAVHVSSAESRRQKKL
jgi:hypothetical protein